ncbi:MAG TPA: glycoside hydrolase family 3 N-terminal domain-containing protein [Candidatus Limnocylindrales bacterium]|nr:glycoside hydrolase family 3 N-terminal domain-containing protein [Candidatus Limnocylindrales bacterium]
MPARRVPAGPLLVLALVTITTLPGVLGSRAQAAPVTAPPGRLLDDPGPVYSLPRHGPELSLETAVGAMIGVSFFGPQITPGLRHLILDDKVGTVLIFADNFSDAASLQRLTADLHALGREAGLPAPLMVAVDEEGGRVMRIHDGVAPLASEYQVGLNGPQAVRAAVAATAAGMRAQGIALDLAPVADLRTNPADAVIGDRSFGGDAARVGPLVAAAVGGLHDGGVAATLKHFPGLGGAAGDPHSAIPTDPESLAQWGQTQAQSFAAGIAAGADAVMTTSVYVPGLDPSGSPALFSAPVVQTLLRQRLDFAGVIVTDSLGMGGIAALYSLQDAVLASVRAGNDLVLLGSGDPDAQHAAIAGLRAAVERGVISITQVRASAARVITMSRRYPPAT